MGAQGLEGVEPSGVRESWECSWDGKLGSQHHGSTHSQRLAGLSRPDRGRWGGVWGPGTPGQACTGGKEAELNRSSEASVLGSAAHLWGRGEEEKAEGRSSHQ